MNNINKGDLGEKLAIKYLKKNSYKILETNFFLWNWRRTKKIAEVDIICQKKPKFIHYFFSFLKNKKEKIIFLEVKTLFVNNLDSWIFPENKVNFLKKKKIQKAGLKWLKNNKTTTDYPWRMDLVTIKILKTDILKYRLKHFKNILY